MVELVSSHAPSLCRGRKQRGVVQAASSRVFRQTRNFFNTKGKFRFVRFNTEATSFGCFDWTRSFENILNNSDHVCLYINAFPSLPPSFPAILLCLSFLALPFPPVLPWILLLNGECQPTERRITERWISFLACPFPPSLSSLILPAWPFLPNLSCLTFPA
jgi:hypothetical protein